MSLILHLMTKDARYLRYELAIWLALVLAQAGLVLSGVDARAPWSALGTIGILYQTLWILQLVIGGIFAAQLVQCDSLVGSTAFWRTRPISRLTLLTAKLASAATVVLAVPFVVELATYVALGLGVGDSLSAACSGLALRAVLLSPVLVIAVVTPDVPRFVVSLILILIGMAAIRSIVSSTVLQPLSVAYDTLTPTLGDSRFLVLFTLVSVCGLAVVVHQYLSLRTSRTIALIPPALILCVAAIGSWPFDFLDRPERPVDRAQVNPNAITLSLNPAPLESQEVVKGPNNARVRYLRLFGQVIASGVPSGTFVAPTAIKGVLKLADGSEIEADEHSARPLGSRQVRTLGTERTRAMLSAIGPLSWSNLDSEPGIGIAPALIDVPETTIRADRGTAGTFTAQVELTAYAFKITGTMAPKPGAGYRHGPKGAEVISVRFKPNGDAEVELREVSVAHPWWVSWWSSSGQYFLVNRAKSEALFPGSDRGSQVLNASWFEPAGAYLTVGRRTLTFKVPSGSERRPIDAAWLAQAEIVRVEPVSLGVFTRPLKVDRFLLEPAAVQ